MNFLHFGDMHESIKSPENRKDDFIDTRNRKIREIRAIGKKYEVTAFLQPGDFLDAPKHDDNFKAEIIQRWTPLDMNSLMQMIMSGNFTPEQIAEMLKGVAPIVGVAGNHELFGNSIKSLPKTTINFLSQMGLIQFATKENPIFFTTEDGLKIAITGTHYHINMDKPEHIDDYIVEEKLGDYHIHIVHGYLTNKNFGNLFRHTTVDQIAHKTKADLTISGHDHIGFDAIEIDGKKFINSGSPVRLSNDLKEIKRRPKVLLISVTKENGIQLKNIYLKSAQDGEEVLDRSKIIQKKENESKIQQIKSTIQKAGLKKGSDITEIISNIADNKQIPENIKDDVVNEVTDMIKKMSTETHNFTEYYITDIILENFQSHENTVIKCSPKLNIFVGESRQGKSSVIRAVSWIYEDGAKNSRRYIKKGADFARATIKLSNGYVISRIVEKKKSGKNGYEIYNPHTGETDYQNTKYLPQVQEMLAFTSLNIGTAKPIPLNFLKQGKGWFFIGDELSGPERAKVIGGIYGTHYADAVLKELEANNKKLTQQMKDRQKDLLEVNENINKYTYLPELDRDIKELEELYEKLTALKSKRDRIEQLVNDKKIITDKVDELENTLKSLKYLDNAKVDLEQLKLLVNKKVNIENILVKREEIKVKGIREKIVFDKMSVITEISTQLESFKNLYKTKIEKETKVQEALKLKSTLNTISFRITELNKVVNGTVHLYEASEDIKKLRNLLSIRQDKEDSVNKAIHLEDKIKGYKEKIIILEKVTKATEYIEVASLDIKKLKELLVLKNEKETTIENHKVLMMKINELNSKIEATEKVLKATDGLEDSREILDRLKALIEKKSKVEEILKQRKQIHIEALNYKEKESKAIANNEKLINEYKDLLQRAGKCPVCLGTIDKATVNRIVEKYNIKREGNIK